jgi:hypothetical protein
MPETRIDFLVEKAPVCSSVRLVRSGETWIEVQLPAGLDPLWSDADRWVYAAAYAAAVARGFVEARAVVIAEAIVCKRLYEGTVYDKTLEQDISRVYI